MNENEDTELVDIITPLLFDADGTASATMPPRHEHSASPAASLTASTPTTSAVSSSLSRRSFLQNAMTAGTGLLIASLLPALHTPAAAQSVSGGFPGSPRPWHVAMPLSNGSLNISTGNVQLAIPITGWSGLSSVNFALVFNNQRNRPTGTTLGRGWTHSYNIYVDTSVSGIARLVDGDGTETPYAQSGASWIAPSGIYDTLVHNVSGTWTLTKKGGLQYLFSTGGQLTSIVDMAGNATTLSYTSGVLTSILDATGAHGLILQYTSGHLCGVLDSVSGAFWQIIPGGAGPTQINFPPLPGMPPGNVQLGYDGSGNVNQYTDQLMQQWHFAYSGTTLQFFTGPGTISGTLSGATPGSGWPASVTWVVGWLDIDGISVAYGLDTLSRNAAQRDAAGNQTVSTFDTANNILSTQLPSGNTWQSSWDTQGNELTTTDPLTHQVVRTFDSRGNILTRNDGNNTNSYTYTTTNVLSSRTDGNSHTTVYGVNGQGQTTSLTDAESRQWLYGFDTNGFRNSEQDPLLNLTHYVNNIKGQVTQRTDALSRVTNYTLDSLGRRTGVAYPTSGNPSLSLAYDGLGNITQTVDGTGTRTYGYDPQGNRTSMSDPRGNTSATYDNRGRILTQTDITGRQLSNSYNNLGQLTGATDNSGAGGATYTYTVDGQTATCLYPNGTKTLNGYDTARRLTTLQHTIVSTSALLIGYTALYDNGNRVTQITEQPSGDVTVFTYDGANNLLSETRTGTKPYSGTYTYDMSNRRKTALVITNSVTTHHGTYSYDGAGRLSQVVDSATGLTELYTWNNDGTLASSPGPAGSAYSLLFDYDEEQHLTCIKHNMGGTITTAYEYGYAADGGRRWQKDYAGNVWTWYPCGVACNAGELVEQTSNLTGSTWTTSALYLKGSSGCGASIIRRNSEYHHFDLQGYLSLVSGASASTLAARIYNRYGVQQFTTGSAQTPWISSKGYIGAEQMIMSVCPLIVARATSTTVKCSPQGLAPVDNNCDTYRGHDNHWIPCDSRNFSICQNICENVKPVALGVAHCCQPPYRSLTSDCRCTDPPVPSMPGVPPVPSNPIGARSL